MNPPRISLIWCNILKKYLTKGMVVGLGSLAISQLDKSMGAGYFATNSVILSLQLRFEIVKQFRGHELVLYSDFWGPFGEGYQEIVSTEGMNHEKNIYRQV